MASLRKMLNLTVKSVLLLVLVCLLSLLGQTQVEAPPCRRFETGKFAYKEEPFTSITIKRTHRIQTEADKTTGLKLRYKIRWTGECEYELVQVWTNHPELKQYNGSVIKVRITRVHANSYEYSAIFNGEVTSNTIVKTR